MDPFLSFHRKCRDGIKVKVQGQAKQIYLTGTVLNEKFTLVVDLSKWAGNTTPEQIVTCAKLFWYCYPRMYMRFGKTNPQTPTTVTLAVENEGYGIAEAGGNKVHIHDEWLLNNKQDFDCLTHEFAHIIQGGWDGAYVPSFGDDTYMIERFADYCRYLYSFQNGRLNDLGWELQTINGEGSYDKSVRFWVWLDYTYSTPEDDIYKNINAQIMSDKYPTADWAPDGIAWQDAFKGTDAYGKDILTLWDEYAATEMAHLSSHTDKDETVSPLLNAVPLREAVRARYASSRTYLKV